MWGTSSTSQNHSYMTLLGMCVCPALSLTWGYPKQLRHQLHTGKEALANWEALGLAQALSMRNKNTLDLLAKQTKVCV